MINLYALSYESRYYPINLILLIAANSTEEAISLIPEPIKEDHYSLYLVGYTELKIGLYNTKTLKQLINYEKD